ncbi:MAG: hypothetical protein ACOC3Z_00475 [Nanoarchaeota archaeon]
MKVLWFSTHFPTQEQVIELEKVLEEKIHIVQFHEKLKLGGGSVIQRMMAINNCKEIVAYKMPDFLMGEIMEYGIKPILADVDILISDTGKKELIFKGFYRVTQMEKRKESVNKKTA